MRAVSQEVGKACRRKNLSLCFEHKSQDTAIFPGASVPRRFLISYHPTSNAVPSLLDTTHRALRLPRLAKNLGPLNRLLRKK